MSGLCGWLAQDTPGVSIDRMAAPIGRFERTPLQSVVRGRAAAALSGSIDCTSLFHEDGLIVALWGSPGQHASFLAQRWRSHGVWACASLAGQFAFAILDERAGEALLAVDRFATRPLHYQLCGQSLLFASSQDALLRHPLASREVSHQALHDYLVLGAMPSSAWAGQHQVAPGECVHLRAGRLVRRQWWRLRFYEHSAPQGTLDDALEAALARTEGNLLPGLMASGGSASGALAAPRASAPVPSFSVAYGPVAPAATHHQLVVTPADLVDAIPKLAALADRPCGDSAAVTHYFCALLARSQGTLRLLSGAGAAELFGAGPVAAVQRGQARYQAVPAVARQMLIEPLLARVQGRPLLDALRRDVPARLLHARPFGAAAAPRMLASAFLQDVDVDAPLALLRQWWWTAQCKHPTNRAIALDLRLRLPARLAAGSLGCGLAGVDVAFPYLDPAVVDCAAHLDPRMKRPARLGVLAAGRRARHRTLPFTAWLQADPDVRALAFDSLSDLRRRHLVADSLIDGLLAAPLTHPPRGFGEIVWQLMMLEQWFVHRAPHRVVGIAAPATSAGSACRADEPHAARVAD